MHVDWNWQEYFYLPDVGLAWWNDIDVVDRLSESKHWQASLLSCWRCLDKLEYSSSWLGSTSAKVCVPSAFDTLSAMPDSLWIQTHSFYFTSHNSNTSHAKYTTLLWSIKTSSYCHYWSLHLPLRPPLPHQKTEDKDSDLVLRHFTNLDHNLK